MSSVLHLQSCSRIKFLFVNDSTGILYFQENDGRACGSDVTHKAESHGRNAMSLNSDHPNIEGNSQVCMVI